MVALFVVVAIAIVGVVAVLVARDRPLIEPDPVGGRPLDWADQDGVSTTSLAQVRFAVALRGYRMEQVDRVLDDTRAALAGRDARIAELQRVVGALRPDAVVVDAALVDDPGPDAAVVDAPGPVADAAVADAPGPDVPGAATAHATADAPAEPETGPAVSAADRSTEPDSTHPQEPT